ncbi:dipeptide ABC transporter ATP-binding protein [Pseudaminobacter soli (ex Li et al. 2025)]|uniref:ABC transporter ATP-binding protein n=1 Tax=Pseudaminobacter soli (ex Li et al. 2025) TaxID=1295366 RepID=A0A2P7S8R0_9HYPH|nr:ABC transporter ATP-binding protein [Mesorhizobium soli]PSJ58879.1 ABC transporter ATP-binding protein [Mesorhizobium soli]
MNSALAIQDLNIWFGTDVGVRRAEFHVVKNVNLELAPGERLGLVGESGSGKTTTILAAMGLLTSNAEVSGRIILDRKDILRDGELSVAPHRWKDIAMVFQGAMSAFNPVKTIGWQIAEAMQVHGVARGVAMSRRIGELLELVGIPADHASRFPHQFSGGMRQRAMIAMALACEPKVLLADEPTTALDVMVQDQVMKLLVRLSKELNLALILVTHDLAVVAQSCHRAAVMLKGEVIEQGRVADLYHRPKHEYTRKLFDATPDVFAAAQAPRRVSTPPSEVPQNAPLLDVRGLSVSYLRSRTFGDMVRGRPAEAPVAVDDVSLRVKRGEMVALVGQSGSGKTTTLQAVLGMIRPRGGSIQINGRDVTSLTSRQWRPLRRQVQMIYQDPYESLDLRYRVRSTVEEPLRVHGIGATAKERETLVSAALDRVGLTPVQRYLGRFPHELSGGQRQRVAIAAAIVLKPELLLADEPVSMLDVSVRAGVLELLNELRADSRMGILMITHDLSTAANYADRVAVMHQGRIVEEGDAATVVRSPRAPYTRALLASIPHPDPDRSGFGDSAA